MDVIEKLFDPHRLIDPEAVAVLEVSSQTERPVSVATFKQRLRSFAGAIDKLCATGERIAILLPQGADAYAAEMGALYCGRSFCPLEPNYPIDRISYCLSDLSPRLLITDRVGAESTRGLGIQTIVAEEVDETSSALPRSGELAYIIYTSGSTGRPKGVCVSRRSMNKFLEWSWNFYDVHPDERWAQFSSLGFDLSLVDLLTCVPCGGALVPVQGLDRMLPGRFIERHGISIWHSVPSVIPLLLKDTNKTNDQLRTLRVASFCGEPLYPQQAARILAHAPSVMVLNTYGPTEGTFFCSAQIVDLALCAGIGGGSLPIGEPIPGWHFQFESQDDTLLEELVIASNYLSEGYISETPDTQRFDVDMNGTRIYRTGDLVRREGANTFFVQRADNQVKVRGNRLDLTELEFHALELGVIEAKAFMQDGVVYIAVNPGTVPKTALEAAFNRHLPRHAIPADIFELSPLPRNANAKIDAAVLRAMAIEKWGSRNGR